MDKKTRKAQVVLAIVDNDRQSFSFLLLLTNKRRGNYWQNVTGKMDEGESYEEGALREAIEETSLKIESIIDIIDLGIAHDFIDDKKRNVHEKSFLVVLDNKWDIKLDPHEHDDFRWITIEELSDNVVKHRGNFEALAKSKYLLSHWGR